MCGGGVCVGGGGRAFYYTYIHSEKRLSYEGAELLSVLDVEPIHPACMCEGARRVCRFCVLTQKIDSHLLPGSCCGTISGNKAPLGGQAKDTRML